MLSDIYGIYVHESRRKAERALKKFLKESKKGVQFRPSDKSNPLVRFHDGGYEHNSSYSCAYCNSELFRRINIKETRVAYREPKYKTPPKGAKDLKILEVKGGWYAFIGEHDVVCAKCGILVEHCEGIFW